jgi:hypothetical protein
MQKIMVVLAGLLAALAATASPSAAATGSLPPALTAMLLSNLDACFANVQCNAAYTRAINACAAYAPCRDALAAFFAANPLIAAKNSGHATE